MVIKSIISVLDDGDKPLQNTPRVPVPLLEFVDAVSYTHLTLPTNREV